MNGSLAANEVLLARIVHGIKDSTEAESAVCVPFPYLGQVSSILRSASISLGAQNVSEHTHGAFTGEVSAAMLSDFGCRYVLVGHSERRALYGETDELVAKKFAAVLAGGMTPVLCVGETLGERESGVTAEVVVRQVNAVLGGQGVGVFANAVIAYEPVWAIGTGRTATPEQAQEVHALIRRQLAQLDSGIAATLRIIYGGSMKASNAKELLAQPDIDGGLIGGASLVADDFLAIFAAAV